jgi:tetratricopeptide (TPR) repeat protein
MSGNFHDKQLVSHLARELQKGKSSKIRKNAALVLGKIGGKQATEVLIRALNDKVLSVRSNAAIALGMIGDKKAVPPLMERLSASSWQERLNAAVSLGWIADSKAADSLLKLLEDRHAYVRKGAAFALGQIKIPEIRALLLDLLTRKDKPINESAVVLAYMGDLSGYFYLYHGKKRNFFPVPETLKRRNKTLYETFKLGNLFYSSSLFHLAIKEYWKAVSQYKKSSLKMISSILNNLADALCSVGETEKAVALYMLCCRLKPESSILANLDSAEVILDIQDLVVEKIKTWISSRESTVFKPGQGVLQFFKFLLRGMGKEESAFTRKLLFLGWKTFYALEIFQGRDFESVEVEAPFVFFKDQIPSLISAVSDNPLFLPLSAILSHLNFDFDKKSHQLSHFFLIGYFAGFLQKIWHLTNLNFSVN